VYKELKRLLLLKQIIIAFHFFRASFRTTNAGRHYGNVIVADQLAAHDTTPHHQKLTILIEVTPLETGQFARAQSGVDGAEEEGEMLRRMLTDGLKEFDNLGLSQRLNLFVPRGCLLSMGRLLEEVCQNSSCGNVGLQ